MLRELITFEVEGQVFGLDIMAIREIRAWSPTTRLPRVPSYVAGVVNLSDAPKRVSSTATSVSTNETAASTTLSTTTQPAATNSKRWNGSLSPSNAVSPAAVIAIASRA